MKSAVETLNPTRVKLTVEVPFDELKPSLDTAYKKIASQVHGAGLPQGQGAAARSSTSGSAAARCSRRPSTTRCRKFYAQAVEESDGPPARPAARSTSPRCPDPTAGGELKFTAEVDVRPTSSCPSSQGIEVTVDDVDGRRRGRRRPASRACASGSAP